ncbi:Allophanate hydrolase subunit 2 [Cyclobacterium lianum]|uniref:Allophanate hydrolase subunit 2 n=1 Tax=Cyclobacterium lianum TaxID=388280 RepID=A0A1M7QIE4_9BACT|nr:biotin-dependent carboxyltransferase family protein [Cyclobacterium lianum]SHN30851.1 Allophanate hydrolase subunit 2 [Cyclobacterium lianum]
MSTLQDPGRAGSAASGVPQSGPMDLDSFLLANHLMRREPEAACLEIYMGGLEMIFSASTQLVFTGAVGKVRCQGHLFAANQVINVRKNDRLTLSPPGAGQWAYMAINGTFQAEKILGSQSFYRGITPEEKFSNNDQLDFMPGRRFIPDDQARVKPQNFPEEQCLRAYPGPSFSLLPEKAQQIIQQHAFTLSNSQSRMGIQLEEIVDNDLKELISAPVYPGTVQLTPSGKMIVLMRDAQVTGGYHRLLQIDRASISKLAQIRPAGKIRFAVETP